MFSTGLCKKLETAAKQRDCSIIADWLPSIKNHVYWCAASSNQEDKDIIEAKYRSIGNHVINLHTHSNEHFPQCAHGPLSEEEVNEKLWFIEGE